MGGCGAGMQELSCSSWRAAVSSGLGVSELRVGVSPEPGVVWERLECQVRQQLQQLESGDGVSHSGALLQNTESPPAPGQSVGPAGVG